MPTLALLTIAAFGCGGTASETNPAPPTAPPPATSAPPPPSAPTHYGTVGLGSDATTFYGSATFDLPDTSGSQETCMIPKDVSGTTASKNAGDVLVEIPTSDAPVTMKITYDAAHKNYDFAQLDGVPAATAPIRVHAPGAGEVPAFDITVPPADPFTITSAAPVLSRTSDDVVVTWSASGNENVVVDLFVGSASVYCRFPAKEQRGTIPKALVQQTVAKHLDSGVVCKDTCAFVSVIGMRATSVVSGDWRFFVSHTTGARQEATISP
jgi:hypothetical protein